AYCITRERLRYLPHHFRLNDLFRHTQPIRRWASVTKDANLDFGTLHQFRIDQGEFLCRWIDRDDCCAERAKVSCRFAPSSRVLVSCRAADLNFGDPTQIEQRIDLRSA